MNIPNFSEIDLPMEAPKDIRPMRAWQSSTVTYMHILVEFNDKSYAVHQEDGWLIYPIPCGSIGSWEKEMKQSPDWVREIKVRLIHKNRFAQIIEDM